MFSVVREQIGKKLKKNYPHFRKNSITREEEKTTLLKKTANFCFFPEQHSHLAVLLIKAGPKNQKVVFFIHTSHIISTKKLREKFYLFFSLLVSLSWVFRSAVKR
jgi:hypothetical protein